MWVYLRLRGLLKVAKFVRQRGFSGGLFSWGTAETVKGCGLEGSCLFLETTEFIVDVGFMGVVGFTRGSLGVHLLYVVGLIEGCEAFLQCFRANG